jgi:hypothetical protein
MALDIAHEGADGREAQIAGRGAVPSLAFDMNQEVDDERRAQCSTDSFEGRTPIFLPAYSSSSL